MKDFGSMSDHDILVVIATKQGSMQESINVFHDAQAFFNANIEERLRYLEQNGAKISQDNAKGLVVVSGRVDVIEGFVIDHDAQVRQSAKIAGIVAGVIATVGVIVTIAVTIWYWGKP
jgi:isopenicillin N synthase-like dioxygenase